MPNKPEKEKNLESQGRKKLLFLFGMYSYFENIFFIITNLLPHPVRILFFKLMFKKLGKNVFIDHWCYFRYPYQICIGDNVTINRKCSFFGSYFNRDTRIVIGNNVAIGTEVKIFAASHHYQSLTLPEYGKSVYIGDNVAIGGGATILPGVKIGEGAFIGAGAVVTRDIPPWSVAAGNPAKVINKRIVESGTNDGSAQHLQQSSTIQNTFTDNEYITR